MFFEIMEPLIFGAVGAGAASSVTNAYRVIRKRIHDKKNPPKELQEEEDDGAENFIEVMDKEAAHMKCPKCTRFKVPVEDMEICNCGEFIRPHFHRECGSCKYDFVMKPFDEKYRPKGSKKK